MLVLDLCVNVQVGWGQSNICRFILLLMVFSHPQFMNQTRQGMGMKMENPGGNPGMRPGMQPGMGGQVDD